MDRHLTPAQRETLVQMWHDGAPMTDIAASVGRTVAAVRKIAARLGLPRHAATLARGPLISAEEKTLIVQMWRADTPLARIAAQLGRPHDSIRHAARRLGLPKQPHHRDNHTTTHAPENLATMRELWIATTTPATEIAARFNITTKSLGSLARYYQWGRRPVLHRAPKTPKRPGPLTVGRAPRAQSNSTIARQSDPIVLLLQRCGASVVRHPTQPDRWIYNARFVLDRAALIEKARKWSEWRNLPPPVEAQQEAPR